MQRREFIKIASILPIGAILPAIQEQKIEPSEQNIAMWVGFETPDGFQEYNSTDGLIKTRYDKSLSGEYYSFSFSYPSFIVKENLTKIPTYFSPDFMYLHFYKNDFKIENFCKIRVARSSTVISWDGNNKICGITIQFKKIDEK